jgi:hypothetical protein
VSSYLADLGGRPVGLTTLGQPPRHGRPELAPGLDVQRDRGLVEHQHVRVADECDREPQPLRLASGQLGRPAVGDIADVGEFDDLLHAERLLGVSGGIAAYKAADLFAQSAGLGYRLATKVMSSRTVRYSITPPVCSRPPMAPALIASAGAMPNTDTVPESGGSRPSIMSMVVVLPAPLGPSRATVSPGAIEISTPRTARTGASGCGRFW